MEGKKVPRNRCRWNHTVTNEVLDSKISEILISEDCVVKSGLSFSASVRSKFWVIFGYLVFDLAVGDLIIAFEGMRIVVVVVMVVTVVAVVVVVDLSIHKYGHLCSLKLGKKKIQTHPKCVEYWYRYVERQRCLKMMIMLVIMVLVIPCVQKKSSHTYTCKPKNDQNNAFVLWIARD